MIEVKDGWTVDEARSQHEVDMLNFRIMRLSKELNEAQQSLTFERNRCHHMHVEDHTCEVCGENLDE